MVQSRPETTTVRAPDLLAVVDERPAVRSSVSVSMLPGPYGKGDNPYVRLLADALRRSGVEVQDYSARSAAARSADLVHLHWPEVSLLRKSRWRALLAGSKLLLSLGIARARGLPIVYTAHNLGSHESAYRRMEAAFWWVFTRLVTHVVSLSAAGIEQVRAAHPELRERPAFVTPHGDYRDEYPHLERAAARATLGLPDRASVILFCGQLRPYKNVLGLVRAVRDIADPDVRLVVSGKCKDADLREQLTAAAADDDRVVLEFGFLDNEALATRIAASDIVVAPYRQIFNSGTALLALSLDRPILLPRTSVMTELQEATGSDWVRLYDGDLDGPLLARVASQARGLEGSPELGWANWDGIAEQTAEVYRQAAAARSVG